MPRDHAQILTRIWADDDFRSLPGGAQRLYMLLLTQDNLSYAGGLDLRVNRWAACSSDTSPGDVREGLAVLAAHRFVVVDEATEELLIRSYVRINEVWKQPKLMTLALRQMAPIQSRRLRHALRVELLRLPDEPRTESSKKFARTLPHTPGDTPPDTPGLTHTDTPASSPADTPTRARDRGRNQEPGTRNQDQQLAVETSGRSVDSVDASAWNASPDDPIPGQCLRHAREIDPPNCVHCQRARLALEAAEAEADRPPPKPPWCRDPTCDPITRLRWDEEADVAARCPECHPDPHRVLT